MGRFMSPCVWEAREPTERRNNLAEATAMWKSDAALDTPDLQSFMVEAPYASPQAAKVAPPPNSWSLTTAVLRTASRGRLRLTGSDPRDPIGIDANVLDHPADLQALKICVEFCRAIGNSVPLRRFAKREILPGPLEGAELEAFIRKERRLRPRAERQPRFTKRGCRTVCCRTGRRHHTLWSAFKISPARSPMTTLGAMVLPVTMRGMIDPSAIRSLLMP